MKARRKRMAGRLEGASVLVTGATNGIGRVTARELAARGARTLIVARDRARGEETAAGIRAETGNPRVEALVADLSSRAEVRRLAGEVRSRLPRLEILVNNAGAIFDGRRVSPDGVEMTFALNHLGYFHLTLELLPLLATAGAARVVNVSSSAHQRGRMDWDDLQGEREYSMWKAYCQSKLANVLFTRELARRLAGTRVVTNALHPGAIATGFGKNSPGLFRALVILGAPFLKTAETGARTTVHVATAPELASVSGRYFQDCRERQPARAARDDGDAARLWRISEEMTGASATLPGP
jgi:NAD(P)-dependent dehydrogenase (short-subunit alcohol dehydrogenase family)